MTIENQSFDLVISGGKIVDGAGNPWYRGDIGIRAGKIAFIGDLSRLEDAPRLDAGGKVVCPGFIDMHNHSDISILVRPTADNLVQQGVTSAVCGNCGGSAAPWSAKAAANAGAVEDDSVLGTLDSLGIQWNTFAEYFEQVEKRGSAVNIASLIGHGNVRAMVLGWENRPPTPDELAQMRTHVVEGMEAGAFGLSYGLIYPPGFYAQMDELVELNKVAARYGGFHAIHMRDERNPEAYKASIREAIAIGEQAGTPVQISHMEAHFPNWGEQAAAIQLLEEARQRGVDVTCDVPPYLLSSSSLSIVFPYWVLEGGIPKLVERLQDPQIRKQVVDEIYEKKAFPSAFFIHGHWDKAWAGHCAKNPQFSGKSLTEIAEMLGREPSFELVMDVFLMEGNDIAGHAQLHSEEDIRTLVAYPNSMICSDTGVMTSMEGIANPRSYGSFPVTFRKYVRGEDRAEEPLEKGKAILSLAEAVRKMTSLPAQRLGLHDRGLVRQGCWADLVIFDAGAICDGTTYTHPHQYPTGIDYVLVNGQVVVDHGNHTGELNGQVLRRGS